MSDAKYPHIPMEVPSLTQGVCKYATLYNKVEFAEEMRLDLLRWVDCPGLVVAVLYTRSL